MIPEQSRNEEGTNFSFSPLISKNGFFEPFTSFSNAPALIDMTSKIELINQCKCCEIKKLKNSIISKVVEVKFTPRMNFSSKNNK